MDESLAIAAWYTCHWWIKGSKLDTVNVILGRIVFGVSMGSTFCTRGSVYANVSYTDRSDIRLLLLGCGPTHNIPFPRQHLSHVVKLPPMNDLGATHDGRDPPRRSAHHLEISLTAWQVKTLDKAARIERQVAV